MNFPIIIFKSTLLSTCIFWLVIISEDFETSMILFMMLSIIPISLCCTITILFTIAPFFWLKKNDITNKDIFKKYFPFYAIVCFSLCFYGIYESKLDTYAISFCTSAFFTTMQSWSWLGKNNPQQINLSS